MKCAEHKVAGFRSAQSRADGLHVTHFAHQNDIGVFTKGAAQRIGEGMGVPAHLSLGNQSRRSQLDFIADLLGNRPNAVLMGDFNCDPDCAEMQTLYRRTRLQPPVQRVPTFPSWRPQRAIDHMLVTPELTIAGMQALPAAQSDHLALSVEMDIPEAALR